MPEWVKSLGAVSDALIPPLALVVAALAWLAKLRWSREFVAAKDAQIASLREAKDEALKAKDTQLETLRVQMEALKEHTYPKLAEILLSTKKGFDAFVELLDTRVKALEKENGRLTARVDEERRQGSSRVAALEQERNALTEQTVLLKEQLAVLRSQERALPIGAFRSDALLHEVWRTALQGRSTVAPGMIGSLRLHGFADDIVSPPAESRTDVSGGSAMGEQRPARPLIDLGSEKKTPDG